MGRLYPKQFTDTSQLLIALCSCLSIKVNIFTLFEQVISLPNRTVFRPKVYDKKFVHTHG